jgi:hypothetical protein
MVDEQGNPIGYAFDIESDNLYLKGTLIWYIKFKSLCGKRTLGYGLSAKNRSLSMTK